MPDDQLPPSREFVDDRRTITDSRIIQRSPEFLSRQLVEADNEPVVFAAHKRDQLLAIDQRCRRHAPCRHLSSKVFLKRFLPDDGTVVHIHAEHMALGADEVNSIFIDHRRRARSVGVTDRVTHVVFVLPQRFAGLRIEAQQAFQFAVRDAIGQKHSTVRDRWSGISFGHFD